MIALKRICREFLSWKINNTSYPWVKTEGSFLCLDENSGLLLVAWVLLFVFAQLFFQLGDADTL